MRPRVMRIDVQCRSSRVVAGLAWLAALVGVCVSMPGVAVDAEDARLEQYLSRLGLTDLRLTYFERLLERETVSAKRTELAVTLANAYAEELAANADQPERFARL